MDNTPKSKFSSNNNRTDRHGNLEAPDYRNNDTIRTPTQNKLSTFNDNDYSPVYIPCTQEVFDQLDVLWDWNSPQSKHKTKEKKPDKKKTPRLQSPKLPIKRPCTNNKVHISNKFKTELEALKNRLVQVSNEKNSKAKVLFNDKSEKNDEIDDLEDVFADDSLEEEMILQSQRIEELFTLHIKNDCVSTVSSVCDNAKITPSKIDLRKVKSDNNLNISPIVKTNKRTVSSTSIDSPLRKHPNNALNDSFDIAFESFNEKLNKSINGSSEKLANKLCNNQEIEQKRLQALAKLKKKQQSITITRNNTNPIDITTNKQEQIDNGETSPIKCSPKEIEQKRLQALAKLEARKKQDIIEKNRREALKRLEMNKKKRALATKILNNKK